MSSTPVSAVGANQSSTALDCSGDADNFLINDEDALESDTPEQRLARESNQGVFRGVLGYTLHRSLHRFCLRRSQVSPIKALPLIDGLVR